MSWLLFQPTMQVEGPPLVQILTTTTLRPFENSVCEKTLKYLMLNSQVVLRRSFLKVW